ncbi:hypothetical protein [Streptacidiphilus rugosus]|uniref:hypothetical protein n=1 Tax=Streptacidiphilus rugosus TaxID=405783 RepID=UPI000564BF0A|nr:hypothetical protein [Streptacidiphilus rugosus]
MVPSIPELIAAHRAAEEAVRDYLGQVQVAHEAAGDPSMRAWTAQQRARLHELTETSRRAWSALQRARGVPDGGEPASGDQE